MAQAMRLATWEAAFPASAEPGRVDVLDLTVSHRGRTLLQHITTGVTPGSITLVLGPTGSCLGARPGLARAVVSTLTPGYGQVLSDPAAGLRALPTQVPVLDPSLQRAELRGLLPAATLSHVGIFASGQAYEQMLLRMMASPLPEARHFAGMILEELKKVMPSFVARVERPDRGGEWITYLERRREADPTNARLWRLQGLLRNGLKDRKGALADYSEALARGADDYVVGFFDPRHLRAKVQNGHQLKDAMDRHDRLTEHLGSTNDQLASSLQESLLNPCQ